MTGAIRPAMTERMEPWESDTMLKWKSKWLRNHTAMVAMRMTEKARWRKSRAFSQSSWATLRRLGRR